MSVKYNSIIFVIIIYLFIIYLFFFLFFFSNIIIIIIIIIRVWALAWMKKKAELIKSFTQCDCGGKNYV